MDLSTLKVSTDTSELELVSPVSPFGPLLNDAGLPMTIIVAGADSDRVRTYERKVLDRRIHGAKQSRGRFMLSAKDVEEETKKRIATTIVGFRNVQVGDSDLVYSEQAALELISNYPWIGDQVDQFGNDLVNFTKASAKS